MPTWRGAARTESHAVRACSTQYLPYVSSATHPCCHFSIAHPHPTGHAPRPHHRDAQLVAYEICRRVADRAISHAGDDLSWLRPYAIVGAGLVAGAAAAVASHPADLLLTRLCGSAVAPCECVIASGVLDQVKYVMSLGFGMYAGLGPRLVMTSAMTSVQFSIYESVRHALGVSNKPPDAVVAPA